MSGNLFKVRERSGNLCSQINSIVAALQNNLPVLYSYCNSFLIRGAHGEVVLINVHLFDIFPAISSGKIREKSRIFSVWRVVNLCTLNLTVTTFVRLCVGAYSCGARGCLVARHCCSWLCMRFTSEVSGSAYTQLGLAVSSSYVWHVCYFVPVHWCQSISLGTSSAHRWILSLEFALLSVPRMARVSDTWDGWKQTAVYISVAGGRRIYTVSQKCPSFYILNNSRKVNRV